MNFINELEKKFTKRQVILFISIIGYYSLLIMATTFGRSAGNIFVRTIDFDVLSQYQQAWNQFSFNSFFHIIVNIGMLLPLGILLPLFSEVFLKAKWMLISSITTSLFIETLQFITLRGSAELDDLLHNTIGMMLGYCIVNIILIFIKKKESHTQIVKYLILPTAVSFVALGIIISYQMKEFGNMPFDPYRKTDMSHVTIKTSLELSNEGKKMPVYDSKGEIVRDVEIISPKEAFQKLKQGDIYPMGTFEAGEEFEGETLVITEYNLEHVTDTKGFSQPVYIFRVQLKNHDIVITVPPISARK
ncbi:VanZ family protein [Bacillus wiedmannii]|uniref:VanZ family protein n=1 Tax=Bacillus wiedmannii TaxID=1890302 RepID=A0A2A7BKQ7_9BACI|nr:VanZ family protein [Bacillus wiedmannii]PDY35093.1 VanZ family protein [Bacillus wiedmannii]PFI53292.1 VanZ family protein [Bacillus cereus]PFM12053.1 VanZ family protein [Bacillus cereus]HDR6299941.1 VanZ family protein [Bacillus cereus]